MFCNCFNPEVKKQEITQEELLKRSGIELGNLKNSFDFKTEEKKETKSQNSDYKKLMKSFERQKISKIPENNENIYKKAKNVNFAKSSKKKWEKPLIEKKPENLDPNLLNGKIEKKTDKKIIYINKAIFEGDTNKDKIEGFGKFQISLEKNNKFYIYEGGWKEGLFSGRGNEIWPDGSIFEGDFRNGVKNGKGLYKWPDFCQYNGNWKNGTFEGFGEYVWDDDKKYLGFWKNGKKHGTGTLVYDGRVFTGEFFNGEKVLK